MGVTVDTELTVDTAMVDTVARDLLILMLKLGVPLDTDTVPDMVLVDTEVTVLALPAMEVTVLALPAMEVTALDTVSGRDLLTPGMDADTEVMVDTAVDMEVMVDADTVDTVERDLLMPGTDVATVDTEDTDTVDIHTES